MSFRANFSTANRASSRIATAIACLLLLVSGCKIPQLRGADPSQPVPELFNDRLDSENSAHLGIEEFFNDAVLTSLIYEGLAGNQELKILAENIQIANNEVLRRRGAYLPFATLGFKPRLDKYSQFTILGADNAQNTLPNGNHFPSPYPEFMVASEVSWQLDIWRQLRNARDAASYRYLGTEQGRNYVVTRLVAEIAENYYSLLALDKRMENLDRTIALQEQSLEVAKAKKEAARDTELAVQRFLAEVRKNQSEKLVFKQEIIETENKINFLLGRFPQPVPRPSENFIDLNLHPLSLGVPAQLLLHRPDIRQAELELAAAGLDVSVARANFYPKLILTGGVGWNAFNPKYLFMTPDSLIYNVAGDLVAPLINKTAIRADYMNANAMQLQALYHYQRTVLNAFTEVINRISKVDNYSKSIEIKKQQLAALEASVDVATNLFQNARAEYIDVLFAQRDLRDARMVLIDTKNQQLSAIVNTYQALGGGLVYYEYPGVSVVSPEPGLPVMIENPAGLPPELVPPLPAEPEAPKVPEAPKEAEAAEPEPEPEK